MSDGTKPLPGGPPLTEERIDRAEERLWRELSSDNECAASDLLGMTESAQASARAWMERALELQGQHDEQTAYFPGGGDPTSVDSANYWICQTNRAEKAMGETYCELLEAKSERDALAAENAALREAIKIHSGCVATCERCGHDTPCATDDVCLAISSPSSAADAYTRSIKRAERERLRIDVDDVIRQSHSLHMGGCKECVLVARIRERAARALGDEP